MQKTMANYIETMQFVGVVIPGAVRDLDYPSFRLLQRLIPVGSIRGLNYMPESTRRSS